MKQCARHTIARVLPAMLLASMAGLFSAALYGQGSDQRSDSTARTNPGPFRLGLLFGIGTRDESVDIVVPGFSAACGRLVEGAGSAWRVGGLLDYAVGGDLRLFSSISFARSTGTLVRRGDPFPLRNESSTIIEGRVDQVVDVTSTGLEFDAMLSYPISERIFAMAGAGLWARLLSEETHREVAISPGTLLLANNQRTMTINEGVLFDHRPLVPRLLAGLRYDLPIGHDSWFSPEIRAGYTILDRVHNGSWKSLELSLGASLRFGLPEGDHRTVIPPPRDTVVAMPVVVPEIRTDPMIVDVEVTEYDSTEAVPLLDRIFFAESGSEIPGRYAALDIPSSVSFTTAGLVGPTLDVYYNILNVIGLRMTRRPEARLRITGHRNGLESETGLSDERAEAIANYLRSVWEIAPDRIETRGQGLPPLPVPERTDDGRAENTIARIETTDATILGPVLRRFVQRVATPPSVTFYPRVIAPGGVRSWRLEVAGSDRVWKVFEGDELPTDFRWNWRSDSGELPSIPLMLQYRLEVTDSLGTTGSTEWRPIHVAMKTLQEKLVERQQDTIIESYSLLLFAYNSPEVSRADRALLAAIASRVGPGARVRFTGFTDSLGDSTLNRDLAFERASNAAAIFSDQVVNVDVSVNPEGGESERYPSELPEGRSYNRTVIIEVRTPITRSEEETE